MPEERTRSGRIDPFAPPAAEDEAGSAPAAKKRERFLFRHSGSPPETGWESLTDIWNPAGKGSETLIGLVEPPEPAAPLEDRTEAPQEAEAPAQSPNGEAGVRVTDAPRRADDHGSRSDLVTLARGGALNFVGALANGVFAFLFVLLFTHGLRTSAAGVFFEAIALFSIVANTAQLGGDDGLVRFVPKFRVEGRIRDLRTALVAALVPIFLVGTAFAIALFLLAPQLSHILVHGTTSHEAVLARYIRILAPFVPFAAAATAVFSASRGFGTMTPSVVVDNIGRSGLRLPLGILVIVGGLGAFALALSWALPILGVFVVGSIWLRSLLRRAQTAARRRERAGGSTILPKTPPGKVAGEFWRFSAPRGLAGVFGITVYWLDTLLLGALRTPGDAAVYTAASRYLYLGFFALGAIQLVIAPMISGLLAEGNRTRARIVYQTATQWLVLASWPVYLTLAAFAPFLLRVFNKGYDSGQHALVTLSIALLISIASGPVMMVLLMSGKSWWTLANSLVAVTLNVVLNLILIPKFGMEGAALAWLASITFNNLAGVLEVRYLLKLTPFSRGIVLVGLTSTVCFLGLGVLTRLALGMSLFSFILFGVVATAIYFGILYRFRGSLHLAIFMDAVRQRNRRSGARAERMAARA